MNVSIIVAADENNVIGGHNQLLWKLPDELKRFRTLTKGHTIIMGRKTHESIGRPLPDRRNIVISRSDDVPEGCELAHSLEEALKLAGSGEVFIIGGGEIYKQALEKGLVDKIYFTRVHGTFDGDVFFPAIDEAQWKEVQREEHGKDADHPFSFTYIDYVKND